MSTFPVNVDVPCNILQCLLDLLKSEAHHLCCFNNHVKNFEKKKKILAAKQQDVKINIENASGVSRVKNEAQQWAQEADNLIEVDPKTKKKWFFGLFPNCCWQYQRGKELAEKTLEIEELLGRCSFNIVAGPADLSSIKYHSSSIFIHFESRKLKFQDLLEALEDGNCNFIGLQGMGGTGKTSMAIEVGIKLEESKFHSVILVAMSNPPDFRKIRGEIARHLNLTLEEGKEEEHSKTIWSRITNKKEKLLIILDDVWEELDLIKDIGIPSSHQHKGCVVLIITRNLHVCEAMGCQMVIQLEMLTDKEALSLFLRHANTSSSRLKGMSQNIVKHCGGLPVAVVAVARALRSRPLAVWREALKTLQNSKSMIDVDENLAKIYKCLKLSYDNLKNEKSKELFFICSLFPKDFGISVELLSRIGMGVGLFGEVEKYCTTRSKVLATIQELLDSCLLLNAEEGLLTMHDLIREVALWMANKDIQAITDLRTAIKTNLRYLFWSSDYLPSQFDGTNLEILLINLDGLEDLKVPHAFFAEMTRLKGLHDTAQSIVTQLFHFRNIKKMNLANFANLLSLCSLSIASMVLWEELTIEKWDDLKHMITNEADNHDDLINYRSVFPKLEKLEIWDCKELEFLFPSTLFGGLKNLKSLTVKNAPELKFVFGRYSHEDDLLNQKQNGVLEVVFPALEVLCLGDVPKIISICAMNYYMTWPSLQIVVLENCNIKSFTGLMVCSDEGQLRWNTTKELHESRGEILPLHADQNPQLQPLNNIRTMKLVNCSNLVSLFALSFASHIFLEILIIEECHELRCIVADGDDVQALMNCRSIFSKLKELHVLRCNAVEYLFPAFVFRSPSHLKYVTISDAPKLKYVFGTNHHDDTSCHENQNIETYIDFPALESLCLEVVPNLVSIFPKNYYIRGLSLKSIVLDISPKFVIKSFTDFMIGWHANQHDFTTTKVMEKRFQTLTDLSVHDSKIEDIFNLTHLKVEKNQGGLVLETSSLEYLTLQNLSELRKICDGPKYTLSLKNLKKIKIIACKSLKTVFSVSILRSLPELWKLEIMDCEELVNIVDEDDEENAGDHLSHDPCFPKLYELHVKSCNRLKYLFSISVSGFLPNLMFLSIKEASKLEHVLIRQGETKEMVMKDLLPELCSLHFEELPSLVGICHGIDFQAARTCSEVYNCPNFSFYEISPAHLQAGLENLDSKVQASEGKIFPLRINAHQFGKRGAEGRQDLETQESSIGSPRGINEEIKEIDEENLISEMPPTESSSYDSESIGQLTNNVGYSRVLEGCRSGRAISTNQLTYSESSNAISTRADLILSPQISPKKALVPMSSILIALPTESRTSTVTEIFEKEDEEEGGLITTRHRQNDTTEVISPIAEGPQITYGGAPLSLIHALSPETSVQGDHSVPSIEMVVSAQTSEQISPLSLVLSKFSGSLEQTLPLAPFEPIYGCTIKHDVTKSDVQVSPTQLPSSSSLSASEKMTPPFSVTAYALTVPGVQEIVEMMNLEAVESFMLAKAFESHPPLRLSLENRSPRMLCFSYRVLLDILNILTTRTPLSITDADKRSLAENLKDASILGFDNNWLESIKTKVFGCDISGAYHALEVLKGLDNELNTIEEELATICEEEEEAALAVQVAQKELEAAQFHFDSVQLEHANIKAHHNQLLEARLRILVQQEECWETFAAKDRHFGL
ncbi:uncharacterized protein LOC114730425 isoform X4 [Neltuma alba]|uniref:uncharacterized protein LOC114730425 isoform X4 n=1 Tax=Neltuma alba TaxID=207710 RepID=UPI0010A4D7D6|nr:uncharacterized protein LOC114730425 isoform X4 [Prosopis alba]